MRKIILLFVGLCCLFALSTVHAQDTIATKSLKPLENKPKVALVLSGGGAKGIAHLPTLQLLDSLGIVPDLIVGNSMGSIVGALYASGYSGDSIVNIVKKAQWDKLMGGGVSLRDVGVEEKAEFNRYIVELDWSKDKVELGNALLNDQNLREFITMLTYPVYDINDFDELPIPFRAIATDIVNGKELVLDNGSLALAMRASMSIPGVFQPVSHEETLLVDGGLLNNFPTDVAKRLGADIIIGSDVGAPTLTKQNLENLQSLIFQSTMLSSNIKRPENRALCDILIDHGGHLTYSTGDFKDALSIYEEGKTATQEQRDTLTALAVVLKQFEQRKVVLPSLKDKFIIDSVTFNGISDANLGLVKARANIKTKTPSTIEDVIEGVNRAMGTTIFKQMTYNLDIIDDSETLEIYGVERSTHRVKGALHYDGYNGVGIIANYTGRNIMGDASRFLITVDVAEQPKLRVQYQKNFGEYRNWWWRTELYGHQLKQKVFLRGQYVDNIRNRYHAFDNQINLNLSALRSYVGFGLKYHNTHIKPAVNPTLNTDTFQFSNYDNYDVELYAQFNSNTMDKVFFATDGEIIKGFFGRSLIGNLKLKILGDPTINYNGATNGFTRLGADFEKRFPLSNRLTSIIGVSGHFFLEDEKSGTDDLFSELALNSKYFLGGHIGTPRNNYYIFPGLKEEEIGVSQFVKLNLGLQYNLLNNIYITPHFNIASLGFGDFREYLDDALSANGKWSDSIDSSILISAGSTFSYNSLLGPINFDVSWVNHIDKVRFFIGIGFHMGRSN